MAYYLLLKAYRKCLIFFHDMDETMFMPRRICEDLSLYCLRDLIRIAPFSEDCDSDVMRSWYFQSGT